MTTTDTCPNCGDTFTPAADWDTTCSWACADNFFGDGDNDNNGSD